ncbi:MAG: sulfatase-like hydrolase/transferase, partial [Leptolyngbyaceae cyanobacterium SM1_4_3]|nr:sulfatase-like hydrolase/transferase [Leptolyngbyaceae cyanobacterium SM1_4_3]
VFLKKLEESGALENTLVIICSDHGEHLGESSLLDIHSRCTTSWCRCL